MTSSSTNSNPSSKTDAPAPVATQVWEELSRRIDQFCQAWESPDPPFDLNAYLPNEQTSLRRMVLIELIKVDLEHRWLRQGLPKQVEEYAAEYPEVLVDGQIPPELIYEEFHIRSQTEEAPNKSEYYERFDQQKTILNRLLGGDTSRTHSTMIGGRRELLYQPGQQLDDFDLLLPLGQGAFANVYLARQRSLQRLVALKISRDKGSESQTLAQLDHPSIVRVYDQRLLPDQKLLLLYMQVVPGGTLQAVVERVRNTVPNMRTGKLLLDAIDEQLRARSEEPPTDSRQRHQIANLNWSQVVCLLGSRLAAALDYAHHKGVLHRDIKPANVLLGADGTPKLADFNVSFSSKVTGITAASFFGGSVAYMSPEQLEASNPAESRDPSELDGRSDLYSLGIMLWELLTGQRPFPENDLPDNWVKMLDEFTAMRREGISPEALAMLPNDMPVGFRELLLSCLAGDPNLRPADGAVLGRQLNMCLQPQAQRLFRPAKGSWIAWLRARPLTCFIVVGVLPSAILSIFNVHFNVKTVIEANNIAWSTFVRTIILPVNGIAYPLGVGLGFWFGWPVVRALQQRVPSPKNKSNQTTDQNGTDDFLRHRCLALGSRIAWITLALWSISGVAIPFVLTMEGAEITTLGWSAKMELFCSQVLFGAMAATQVFFYLTLLCLSVFYPLLIVVGKPQEDDLERLDRLEGGADWVFWAALVTPFVAIFMLLQTLSQDPTELKQFQEIFGLIAILGFIASGLAYYLLLRIQAACGALRQIATGSDFTQTWTEGSGTWT